MIPDDEKTWVLNDENYLKLWRLVHEHESSINTLFADYEKLKKMYRALKKYQKSRRSG